MANTRRRPARPPITMPAIAPAERPCLTSVGEVFVEEDEFVDNDLMGMMFCWASAFQLH